MTKDYDALVKGYVNTLIVAGSSKMQIPKDDKLCLGIVQGYIVFQAFLLANKLINIEIAVSDTNKTKRRIFLTSNTKEIIIHPLHCRIPLINLPTNTWANISINVQNIAAECFKPQTFRSIDSISITANCKIRRIFSMKNNLVECNFNTSNLSKQLNKNDKNEDGTIGIENIDALPKTLVIPSGISVENININYDKIKSYCYDNEKLDKKDLLFKKDSDINFKEENLIMSPINKLYYTSGVENLKPQTGFEKSETNKPKRNLLSDGKKTGIRSKSNNIKCLQKRKTNIEVSDTPEQKKFNLDSPIVKEDIIKGLEEFDLNHNIHNNNNINGTYKESKFKDSKDKEKEKDLNDKMNKSDKFNKDKDKDKLSSRKPIKPKGKLYTKKDITKLKLPGHTNINNNNIDSNEEHKSKMLLNTVQFQNNEKWETTENNEEAIEEIYEIDEGYTENEYHTPYIDNREMKKNEGSNDKAEHSILNNDDGEIEERLDRYYDIPIKKNKNNAKNKNYYETPKEENTHFEEHDNEADIDVDLSKNKIISEILKENFNKKSLNDSLNRPFTPPFNNINAYLVCDEKINENLNENKYENDDIVSNSTGKITLDDKYKNHKYGSENPKEDLVYDYVLECYYHPHTNIYYELEK